MGRDAAPIAQHSWAPARAGTRPGRAENPWDTELEPCPAPEGGRDGQPRAGAAPWKGHEVHTELGTDWDCFSSAAALLSPCRCRSRRELQLPAKAGPPARPPREAGGGCSVL